MIRAHKIALAPNNVQATYFAKAAGTARFAYNWALAEWQRQYEAGEKPSEAALRRQLNALKAQDFPWMEEVTKNAPQMAIIHLGQAFQRFFAGQAKYPTFKKKGVHEAFTLTNDQFRLQDRRIRIPKLGWVKLRECLRFEGKLLSATISRVAQRWFVSLTVEVPDPIPLCKNQAAVGVDLGLTAFATLSSGEKWSPLKPHRAATQRLQRLSRSLSRKKKGSKNRHKAKQKLARLHARISHVRRDALHQLTTWLTQHFGLIGIEDLNVRGMLGNRHLARSLADASFHEFRRQLKYKATASGARVFVADRFFASSKLCSACGHLLESLPLSVRQWICPECKASHDRDVNAARNLEFLAVSSTVTACGEGSDGATVLAAA